MACITVGGETGLRPVPKHEICLFSDKLISFEHHIYRLKSRFLLRQFAGCALLQLNWFSSRTVRADNKFLGNKTLV